MKYTNLMIFCGFIISLAGFTPDLFGGSVAFRLAFTLLGSVPILLVLQKKSLSKPYYLSFILFTLYIIVYIYSCFINEVDYSFVFRELILYLMVILIYFLIPNQLYFKKYIYGITIGLSFLIVYFFVYIDFTQLLAVNYRLATNLNSISLAYMALVLFTILLPRYFEQTSKIHKMLIVLMILMSIIIMVATKSRTVLILMVIVFVILTYNQISKKWYILFIGIFIYFLLNNIESIQTILRLSASAQVGGADIASFSGRTTIWKHAIEIISNNFYFGAGPEKAVFRFHGGSALDFHNAYLQIFGNVGIFGFLPILILLLIGIYNTITIKGMIVYKLLFIIGLIGGITEARLFNFGSPANLLILISILKLSFISKRKNFEINY